MEVATAEVAMTLVDITTLDRMEGIGGKILVLAVRSRTIIGTAIPVLRLISTSRDTAAGGLPNLVLQVLEEAFLRHRHLQDINKAGVPKASIMVVTTTALVQPTRREVIINTVVDGMVIGRSPGFMIGYLVQNVSRMYNITVSIWLTYSSSCHSSPSRKMVMSSTFYLVYLPEMKVFFANFSIVTI